MFESAEVGHKVSKSEQRKTEGKLRKGLLEAQYRLLEAKDFSVVILVDGIEGAGKGDAVNLLNKWMDPRHIAVRAFGEPTTEQAERPYMWRYWRMLPPRGEICVMFGHWYAQVRRDRVEKGADKAAFERRLDEIRRFETMLADENVLLVKLWFHLSKSAQQERFERLSADERTRWRVTEEDWQAHEQYDLIREVAARMLRGTDDLDAPWIIVDSEDENYRSLFVGRALLEALSLRLAEKRRDEPETVATYLPSLSDQRTYLASLELDQKCTRKAYDEQLEILQGRLALLTRHKAFRKRSLVLVFEGVDAAGKGGAIRRITAALDARHCRVIPVGAPTDEEAARPYLWRFWRHAPRLGWTVIFDRSWYGRVLVERVEGLCAETDWRRAYGEIVDFESDLEQSGAVVLKFWIAIDRDEQLKRFRERAKEPHKRFKLTSEDWRNRKKWDDYEAAASEMLERTGGERPWTIVEGNNKLFARLKILRTICERLEEALGVETPLSE